MIIDQTHGRVLEVLPSRKKETVAEWLRANRDSGRLAHLEEATTDMYSGFTEAVREVFGDRVRLVIDRFHVMKNFQDRLEAARREIQRRLHPEAAKGLKGLRWLFITNPENLSADQRQELEELKELYPELGRLHDLRERLRSLFEDRRIRRPETAAAHLRAWIAEARSTGLTAVETFCRTLENWTKGIANYFVNRSSNGPTESLNQKLRTILWRAFGLRNFEHFRLRALDTCGRA